MAATPPVRPDWNQMKTAAFCSHQNLLIKADPGSRCASNIQENSVEKF